MKTKSQKTISKNLITLFVLSFFIPFIIAIIGLILGHFEPFGSNDIMTKSGNSNVLTYYIELWNRFHNGEIFGYSLKSGLGYDFTSVVAYYLSDPINMIILIFPLSSIFAVLNILYAVKIGLAGLFFSIFLSYHDKQLDIKISKIDKSLFIKKKKDDKDSPKKKSFRIGGDKPATGIIALINSINPAIIAFSTAYALSGYMLSYGMNTSYLSAIALFPLIILGIEKLTDTGNPLIYIIAMVISFYCSFYISCITAVFSVIYLIVLTHKDTTHKLLSFLKLILSGFIIFGLSSPIILNSINSVFFKKDTSLHFPKFGLFNSFFDVIQRQLTTASPSQLIKFGNGIDIYCGIFIILFISLYITNKAINYSEKIKKLCFFVILLLATYVTTPNYFFNFFFESEDKNSVFAYTLVFVILLISYESYKYMSFISKSHVLISGFISIALIACSLLFCVGYDSISIFITGLEFIVFYMLLLLLWRDHNIADHITHIILGVLILFEIMFTYCGNIRIFSNFEESYYNTESYKISTIEDYLHKSDPSARILVYEAHKTDSTPITNAILGYDYVITKAGTTPMDSNLIFIETTNDIDIYSNPDSIHSGIFVDKSVDLWNNSSSSRFTSLNLLAKCITDCDDIFDFTIGEFSSQELFDIEDLAIDYSSYLHNSENRLNYTLEDSGDFYTNLSHIIHVGNVEAGEHKFITYNSTQEDAKTELLGGEFALFNSKSYKNFLSRITVNNSDSIYNIELDAPSDGYVLLPIENSKNLKLSAGKNSIKSFDISGDLVTLISVDQGINNLSLTYRNSNTSVSIILIIIAILMLAVLIYSLSKQRKECTVLTRISHFFYTNRVYLYTILITAVLYLITLMMTKCIPFGTKSGIVSDGYAQSYPSYTKLISDLKAANYGALDYSIGYYGGGRSAWSWLAFMNPIWLLGFLFPASQSMLAFNFVYFATFLFVGPSMIFYLTHRPNGKSIDKTNLKLVPIALAYNLSSYAFMYLSFASFIELCVFTPLIILAMENVIYKKRYLPYIFLLAYIMLWSYYMAFLLCEFLFLYFFVSEFDNFKDFFFKGLRFGICSIIAAGLVAFSLLPSFGSVQTNNYAAADTALKPGFSLQNSMLNSLLDIQVMPRVNLVTEFSNRANTYCGILCILLLGVFLTKKSIRLSVRIRRVLLILLLYFSYSNPFMNYVLHGFHLQSMVPNRFAIFNIFMLVNILVDCVTSNEEESRTEFIAYIIGTLLLGFLIIINNTSIYMSIIITMLFIVAYLAIQIYGYVKKNNTIKTQLMLSAFILELIVSFLYFGNRINGIEVSIKGNDVESIKTLSREYSMKEYPLTRTEIIASNLINSSILTDTNAISNFTSFMDSGTSALSSHWNTMTGTNYIQYDSGNPLGNIMLNVRYFITNDFADTNIAPSYMNEIKTMGNIHLYEDPGYVGNGIIFDKQYNLDSYKSEYSNSFDEQNDFTQMFVQDNLYNIVEVETDINKINEETSYIMMDESEGTNIVPTQIYISKNIIGDIYMDYYGQITYLGYCNGTKQELYELNLIDSKNTNKNYDKTVRIAVLNTNCIRKMQSKLSENVLQNLEVKDNYIKGNSNSSYEGTVYISLPYSSAWKAYIDGSEVSLKLFLDGMGIDIPSGNHNVELRYEPSGKNYSYYISLLVLLLVIGYIIKLKVEKKKAIV